MKIDRLIAIIMVLLEKDRISATKLAEMFEVTPRTIYRDIDTLDLAGIPIVTYPGVNGGIGIMENYKVSKQFFIAADITALLSGLRNVSTTLTPEDMAGTMAKVKSLIPEGKREDIEIKAKKIYIDLSTWSGNTYASPNLDKVKSALEENLLLTFSYSNSSNKKTIRRVEPYQLVLKEGCWYLKAYCMLREEFRIFKLNRMFEVEVLDSVFTPRDFVEKNLDSSGWIDQRIIYIKLKVHSDMRERVIERCKEVSIKPLNNDYVVVDFPFVEDELGYGILLSFGHRCECLEPQHIREEIQRRIKKMTELYCVE